VRVGERVLAAGRLTEGSWAAATGGSLLLAGERLDWALVTHAEWDHETSTLELQHLASHDGSAGTRRLALEEPGRLPEVVRERVTASIVVSRHVPVEGRAGVRIVARRRPGEDDLLWQVVVDPGLEPDDERVRAAGEAGIVDLRRELGV
jgi:hypothetical protein